MGSSQSSTRRAVKSPKHSVPKYSLVDVFNTFDIDHDGKISAAELGTMMETLGQPRPSVDQLESLMGEVDSGGDGFMSLEEFVAINTKGVDEEAAAKYIREAFAVFDFNRDGLISPTELQKVLKNMKEEFSIKECMEMIKRFDQDGDGFVNFEEFKIMLGMSF